MPAGTERRTRICGTKDIGVNIRVNNTRQQFAETLDRAPAGEPERQYYFLDRLREVVEKKKAEEGFSATFHIETYGCRLNIMEGIV